MQRFVSVAFRHGQPVAQTLRVGLVHIRYDGICLPTFQFLFFYLRIQNHTDCEQVVHALERTLLLFHLLVDGVNGLGASFDVEVQSRIFQLFLYRSDESGYILVA